MMLIIVINVLQLDTSSLIQYQKEIVLNQVLLQIILIYMKKMIHIFIAIIIVIIVVKLELIVQIIVIYVKMDIISFIIKLDNVLKKVNNQLILI